MDAWQGCAPWRRALDYCCGKSRRLAPLMRTAWEREHILSRQKIALTQRHFYSVETHLFHLAGLLAVPFLRPARLFDRPLGVLDGVNRVLLSLPDLRWWSWQCLFALTQLREIAER